MRTAGITLHAGKEVRPEKPPKYILCLSEKKAPSRVHSSYRIAVYSMGISTGFVAVPSVYTAPVRFGSVQDNE